MALHVLKQVESAESGRVTVLAVGPWDQAEFAATRAEIADDAAWIFASDCNRATALLERDEVFPEVILLAQPLPGAYRQEAIDAIRRLAPLAEIVVVAGTWCEGEPRTGVPLAGVMRLYWYEVVLWWQSRDAQGLWSTQLNAASPPRSHSAATKIAACIAIRSPSLAAFEALASALMAHGAQCAWVRTGSIVPTDATLGLWDGGQLDPAEWRQLEAFASELHERRKALVVLLDFPRREHFASLRTFGCRAVLAKPYVVRELAAACKLVINT